MIPIFHCLERKHSPKPFDANNGLQPCHPGIHKYMISCSKHNNKASKWKASVQVERHGTFQDDSKNDLGSKDVWWSNKAKAIQ